MPCFKSFSGSTHARYCWYSSTSLYLEVSMLSPVEVSVAVDSVVELGDSAEDVSVVMGDEVSVDTSVVVPSVDAAIANDEGPPPPMMPVRARPAKALSTERRTMVARNY